MNASLYTEELAAAQSELERSIGRRIFGRIGWSADLYQYRAPHSHEPPTPFIRLLWDPQKSLVLKPLEHYQQQSLLHRKELRIKDYEFSRERRRTRFDLKTYLPSFTLFGTIAHDGFALNKDLVTHEVGGRLDWKLFDGLSSYHASQAAHAQQLKLLMEKQDLIQTIRKQVETAYAQLRENLKLLSAEKIRLEQAHNEFILREQQYTIGEIAIVDLDAARFAWENARFNWLTRRIDSEVQMRLLLFVCGYPPENSA